MKFISFFFGIKTMGYLLALLGVSMAAGTFIESAYDTPTAKILIYNTSWFESIFILLTITFITSIQRYKLFKKKKWGVLILHLSFVLMIIGAGITRYIGYEGAISLKEGEATDKFITEKTYLTILIDGTHQGQNLRKAIRKEVLLSEHVPENIEIKTNFKNIPIAIETTNFYTTGDDKRGHLSLNITVNNQVDTLTIIGTKGKIWPFYKIHSHGLDIWLNYGSIVRPLPFKIKLNDFIATKYPGTINSYSGFKSKVQVTDQDKQFNYDIFMNHILSYRGFRFYQASFHPDEKGSILSVNHDYWGSLITYCGYFLLYASFIWLLFFDKNSHFKSLKNRLLNIQKHHLLLLFSIGIIADLFSQEGFHKYSTLQIDSILTKNMASKEISEAWSKVLVQDNGRVKPINTYASELLRKLSKKDKYLDMDANQALLSMTLFPMYWYQVPIIKLPRKNKKIRWDLELPPGSTHAALSDFFTETGFYKLTVKLQKAHMAKQPNVFQKDIIGLDQRVNLLHQVINGEALNIFPVPGDKNQTWVSSNSPLPRSIKRIDSLYIRHVFGMMSNEISKNNTEGAFAIINAFKGFQKKHGKTIIPSEAKINTEILYNRINMFNQLYKVYLLLGIIAIVAGVRSLLKRKRLKWGRAIYCLSILGFILQTFGLITRWYLSDHAPWSDAYESLLYTSWSTMLFTIFFSRKSLITLGGGLFASSMILMISHWNWLDPSISNLEPVLNSYWLMIHVTIIVSSYGPFTLSTILGMISLILMMLKNKGNHKEINRRIKELTIINEINMTIGLALLATGNFLGGQWANESWGRYWGWDPKETWALISIVVYTFIIHMRLIKGLKGAYAFNLMSVLGFLSILMTYFGVNFYLTGLHSYASGDQMVTPTFVYISFAVIFLVAGLSYLKQKRFE